MSESSAKALTHPDLGTAIQRLYPTAKALRDYEVARDREGKLVITKWNEDILGPLPDLAQVERVLSEPAPQRVTLESLAAQVERLDAEVGQLRAELGR